MHEQGGSVEFRGRRRTCGCWSGALFMGLGAFGSIGHWLLKQPEAPTISAMWPRVVVCAVVGGVIGKLGGVLWGKAVNRRAGRADATPRRDRGAGYVPQ
jgi:hypothetical protein